MSITMSQKSAREGLGNPELFQGGVYVTKNGYGDMVIMSMEIYESTMKQIAMYRDIEISEKQIEAGQVKDARTALRETRAKYGL